MIKNILDIPIDEGGAAAYEYAGRKYFADASEVVEITEIPSLIFYDERNGYMLPDGRTLAEIAV